jgi:PilZ domain
MRLGRKQSEPANELQLPEKSDTVTLVGPTGERIQARIAERGEDTLLVYVMFRPENPLTESALKDLVLEFAGERGRVRLRGTATLEDRDTVRLSGLYSIEVLQEREFVRVRSTRPVLISDRRSHSPIQTFSVDVSGGGLLLAGPNTLKIGEQVDFRLTTTPGSNPIVGTGTVVRTDVRGHRAICFDSISDGDHRRLVRFIFDCQRAERRRGLDQVSRNGK